MNIEEKKNQYFERVIETQVLDWENAFWSSFNLSQVFYSLIEIQIIFFRFPVENTAIKRKDSPWFILLI